MKKFWLRCIGPFIVGQGQVSGCVVVDTEDLKVLNEGELEGEGANKTLRICRGTGQREREREREKRSRGWGWRVGWLQVNNGGVRKRRWVR